MEAKRNMIEMNNVVYAPSLGSETVLAGLSLRIPEGQWVSIAGANGSGKSTLVKLINGLLRSHEGRIAVDGLELADDSIDLIRQRVGIIFQNPDNQFIGLTVADDIIFGLENLGLDRETMKERLEYYADRLHVTHLLARHPGQLSGGQKQRAAIAAILAMEPKIVIFDEAASMLDEKGKFEFIGIMRQMRSSGRYTIVNVTHDLDEMIASDRIIALFGGSVAGDGAPGEILKQEALLAKCRLKPPFALELSRQLRRRGVDIGEALNESEVLEALWAFDSIR